MTDSHLSSERIPSLPRRLYNRVREMAALRLLPARDANLLQCHQAGLWEEYFDAVEVLFEGQWQMMIWPLIRGFDFRSVLELAPGGGRNTQKLCTLAAQIVAVDYNEYTLNRTRKRLGGFRHGCAISYYQNNGTDLKNIPAASVTAVYCWDSAVHFDREVLTGYIAEFARVLRPGGCGFVHHSDLGGAADRNIKRNPHWRSSVDRAVVRRACERHGLTVERQQPIPWPPIVDCATVFRKQDVS